MQKITLSISLVSLAGVIALFILFFTGKQQIAYVDNNKLLDNYKAMIDARKVYESKAKVWHANIDTLMGQVQGSIQRHEKEVSKMSARERSLSEELIKSKQKQLRDYQVAIQEKAKQEDMDLTGKVLKQANALIEKYGKEHNYKIILAATASGNIVYAEDGLDITDKVLEELNKDYTTSSKK